MPILSLQNVVKEYLTDGQAVLALCGVSLEVQEGEFVALAGRSGCGKSTLLNLAGAMDFPTSGVVEIDGASTASLSDAELTKLRRDKVGFIFQSFQLLHTLTVIENVELPLLLSGRKNARDAAHETAAVGRTGRPERPSSPSTFGRTDAACRHCSRFGAFS